MRRRWWSVLAGLVALVVALGMVGVPASAAAPIRYVALGDSSASGPMIPTQIDIGCARSSRNWPHLLAARLGATLTDATCSGARTSDLAAHQFAALRRDTDLVTLAIAANDIDLGSAFVACANPDDVPGPSCQQRYTVNGVDQYAARIAATAPKVAAALEEIHRRSPRARVAVVGYLTYWSPGGCHPPDPIPARDADYMQATFDRLMAMLAREAAAHRATYVDIRTPSARHGLCEEPTQRWLEGAVPAVTTYPYHPNATGMANAAALIDAALTASRSRRR